MSCSPPDNETVRWYADKVRRYGFDHRGLGFRTRSSQERRFEALCAVGELDGRTVLDVGCGFGDLLAFLERRGIRARYTGLDVCAPMIDRCRERFGGNDARFVVADVLDFMPDGQYDYVLASGIFGLDAPGARQRIRPTLERMFAWCRIGMAANFLSGRSPAPVEGRVYVDPGEALALGFALTPALRLDHNYLPNDFTLQLFRSPAWAAEKASVS
ncbi:MAG TPA: class I SAM-dependent methyltransferase [Usitatibacter sp.]|nr:class I SAM-dependent methyltransferase [Usitatibacter sp.]